MKHSPVDALPRACVKNGACPLFFNNLFIKTCNADRGTNLRPVRFVVPRFDEIGRDTAEVEVSSRTSTDAINRRRVNFSRERPQEIAIARRGFVRAGVRLSHRSDALRRRAVRDLLIENDRRRRRGGIACHRVGIASNMYDEAWANRASRRVICVARRLGTVEEDKAHLTLIRHDFSLSVFFRDTLILHNIDENNGELSGYPA